MRISAAYVSSLTAERSGTSRESDMRSSAFMRIALAVSIALAFYSLTASVVAQESASAIASDDAVTLAETPVVESAPAEPTQPAEDAPHTASFSGIEPGVSTREQTIDAWGTPREVQDANGADKQVFSVPPFSNVEVTYVDGKVASILVRLEQRFPAAMIAKQLGLERFKPVLVPDDVGQLLGEAFPERGVLFSYASDSKGREVSLVILEPLAAQPFLLRAEATWRSDYTSGMRDVEFALSLAPNEARAHWLKSEILMAAGQATEALAAVEKAVELASNVPEFRLTRARLWRQTGQHDRAVLELREAESLCRARPELAARAQLLLGDELASGPKRDFRKAMEQHLRAIEQARDLIEDPRVAVRRAAKEVLLDATLAAARDVAWGDWKNKPKTVPQWIDKARAVAKDLVKHEQGSPELGLRVARQGLAACVGTQGAIDPTPWLEEALAASKPLEACACPIARGRFAWDLGLAWYDALQCYQMRDEHERVRRSGQEAVALLERGWPQMQNTPGMSYLMGRLYFRLGALSANQDHDHAQALAWYERARPLLERVSVNATVGDALRQGEALVSMAVSYWETGRQDDAVRITEQGAQHIERAVADGSASKDSLRVPYGNLAQMLRAMGQEGPAERYDRLAERPDGARPR